jgi:hypothetical protein
VVNIYRVEIEQPACIAIFLLGNNNFIVPNSNIKEFTGVGDEILHSSNRYTFAFMGVLD